jgi:hypothetical protein
LKIRQLAERVTRGLTNDYDRSVAVERYLKSQYLYSLEPPLLPSDEDAADFFLFTSRTGYCEQFATAMVVMLRTLHIPSRFVVGYAPGEYDSKTGEWVVRELDAHAWVEVFFPGFGWITFDPTGGIQAEQPGFFSIKKLLSQLLRILASRELLPTMILLTFAAMFLYILKTEGYDRFLRDPIRRMLMRRRSGRPNDPRWDVEKNYLRLQKTLRRKGAPYHFSQTPLEFQEATKAMFDDNEEVMAPLVKLTRLYNEAVYDSRPLDEGSGHESKVLLRQVQEGLKRVEKS